MNDKPEICDICIWYSDGFGTGNPDWCYLHEYEVVRNGHCGEGWRGAERQGRGYGGGRMSQSLTIFGQPITKKNSQQIIMAGKRPCIIPSKAFKAYEKLAKAQLSRYPITFTGAIEVTCLYYLETARMPDLTNLLAATHDILEHCGIIDNDRNIISVDGSRIMGKDPNPRVEIEIKETP